jgi:uncharacterized membrane protein
MAALLLVLSTLAVLAPSPACAQQGEPTLPEDEILEATVVHIADERQIDVQGRLQLYQRLELAIVGGPRHGEIIVVEHGTLPMAQERRYRVGERVYVRESGDLASEAVGRAYYLDTPSRWIALAALGAVLVAIVLLVSGARGLASLSGLALSIVVLFVYILPRLGAGQEPLGVIMLGAALMVPLTFFLAHGFSIKTLVAVVGTALALALTVGLGLAAIRLARLSGYGSEDAMLLQALSPGVYDLRNLLLAGMVVGALGVLDDVTVSQAAIVQQLAEANPQLHMRQLYTRAMRVGQDHIASVVNTLALVYAGAALPLLLLLRTSDLPLRYLLSQEIIAEEIVRAAVASIGLMAAVPLTTLLAAGAEHLRLRFASVAEDAQPE